jgi:uncharacterized protein
VIRVLMLALLRVYRFLISPILHLGGARCRFYPTCSAYAEEAIKTFGPWRGTWMAMRRLSKCHPFHPGGVDHVTPPPETP